MAQLSLDAAGAAATGRLRIVVVGASGRAGSRIASALAARGHEVTALGRSFRTRLGDSIRCASIDLEQPESLVPHLAGAEVLVGCAHAGFTQRLLEALDLACPPPAAGPRLVVMGSTRRYMQMPDADGVAIRAGEEAFAASGRPGVMLHSTMIYGHADDRNVARILALIARFPRLLPLLLPLPGGGRNLVQPIHIDDVVAAVVSAAERRESDGPPIILAGPRAISYAELVRACARCLGRRAVILPLPLPLPVVTAATELLERAGVAVPVSGAEWRRASEDKSFDIAPMQSRLGVTPRPLESGLGDCLKE